MATLSSPNEAINLRVAAAEGNDSNVDSDISSSFHRDHQAQIAMFNVQTSESPQQAVWTNRRVQHIVRTFPVEMLREIFRHCTNRQGPVILRLRSPCNLAHVSQRWREISISFPELWTTIKVGFQPTADIPMLSSMLARSHAKALDISIGPAGESSFQTLLPSSSRWRTLHLVELEQIALLQPARGHLDSLTELCIRFPDTEQIHQNGPLNIFDVAPLLQKVELIYEHDQEYPEVFLPWPTITELTAKSLCRLYISLAVLPLCKNLVFASIDELDCDGANSILAIMSLPRLTNLHLHASQAVAIALFLDKLAAPTLKSLHLKTLGPCLADEEIDSVTSLVERDGCSLTDIQFRNMRFTPLQFTGFLASSPNITRFVSDNDCGDKNYDDDDDDDESITSLLTLSPGDSDVLSKLTHLGLVDVDETGIGELLDMIESRPGLTPYG